ncbi:MAG: helix-turn-helix transcriptional regulator [Adlercreutzia sp.]|nr:helix-turn-helix transcriptional regulator [Adlercreutzia sp.]
MTSYLLDLLANVATGPRRDELPTAAVSLQARLLPACLQACILLGALALAVNPGLFCSSSGPGATTVVFMGALGAGALAVLLSSRQRPEGWSRRHVVTTGTLQIGAAFALAVGLLDVDARETALTVMLLLAGLAAAPSLLSWSLAFASRSREDVFVNSVVGFAVFDLFLVTTRLVPSLFPPLLLAALVLGSLSFFVHRTLLAGGEDSPYRGSVAEDEASEEAKERLKGLLASVPYLGTLLYFFTIGIVAWRNTDRPYTAFFAAAALLVVLGACVYTMRNRRDDLATSKLFLVFDIGLPGMAVFGFAIKMIPLELLSITIFPCFMEMYFIVLLLAFWINLALFGIANKEQLAAACGIIVLGATGALGLGAAAGLLDDITSTIILGLVTAAFLILAIVSVGYGLILYAKGAESEPELAPAPPNLADVCRRIGEEQKLTPRELEVLEELAYGHSSSYIAKVLYVSNNTARSHMKNIYKKLGVSSREELIELLRERQSGAEN